MIICVYEFDYKKRKGSKICYFFLWIALVLIAGLQDKLGGDNLSYEQYFQYMPSLQNLSYKDFVIGGRNQPLWIVFISLVKSIKDSYVCFHIIHSLVVNSVLLYFFSTYSNFRFTVALLFFLSFNFLYFNIEIQRESLAVIFFCISIKFILKKHYLQYYLINCISFLFHVSAIIAFVYPLIIFIIKKYRTKKLFVPIIALVIFLFINIEYAFHFIDNPITQLMFKQFTSYANVDRNMGNIVLLSILQSIPIVLALIIYKPHDHLSDFFYCNAVFYLILILSSPYVIGLSRMSNYLLPSFFIYLVDATFKSKFNNKKKIFLILCYVLFIILIIYQYTRPSPFLGINAKLYQMYIPYKSIFD